VGAVEHVERHRHVVVEGGGVRYEPVDGDRGEVDQGVHAVVAGGHAEERVQGLPVVPQLDAGETRAACPVEVEPDHVVAVVPQPRGGGAPQLAAAARDGDAHATDPRSFLETCQQRPFLAARIT
jgi:hypothetical protein